MSLDSPKKSSFTTFVVMRARKSMNVMVSLVYMAFFLD